MAELPAFTGSWPWPWPWIGSYCIPLIDLYLPLPHWYRRNFLRTDGRTYGWAGGHLRIETCFIRSSQRSRPNNDAEKLYTHSSDFFSTFSCFFSFQLNKIEVSWCRPLWSVWVIAGLAFSTAGNIRCSWHPVLSHRMSGNIHYKTQYRWYIFIPHLHQASFESITKIIPGYTTVVCEILIPIRDTGSQVPGPFLLSYLVFVLSFSLFFRFCAVR